MKITLRIVKSFSVNGSGGNPAGVVLDSDQLTKNQKQSIARQAGLSETAFISASSVADFKLEFFTPTRQIPHCGHATIATFWFLKSLGKIHGNESSKETIDGTRKIFFKGDEPFMEQLSPRFDDTPDHESIFESIGLSSQLDSKPIIGNTGNSFVLIRLNQIEDLGKLNPDFEHISKISSSLDAVGYYVYALSPDRSVIQTRMFAPSYGINEESATGMAAGPLAAYLYPELKKKSFYINQGKFMVPPSESKLNVSLNTDGDNVKSILVGGSAHIDKTIEISI